VGLTARVSFDGDGVKTGVSIAVIAGAILGLARWIIGVDRYINRDIQWKRDDANLKGQIVRALGIKPEPPEPPPTA